MVLFKKKEPKFSKVKKQEEVEEEPEEYNEEETEEVPSPNPIPKQRKEIKELVEEKTKNVATIISAELVEGMRIRTIFISNESIGEVGETFDLDED